jgi:hypothetical protein
MLPDRDRLGRLLPVDEAEAARQLADAAEIEALLAPRPGPPVRARAAEPRRAAAPQPPKSQVARIAEQVLALVRRSIGMDRRAAQLESRLAQVEGRLAAIEAERGATARRSILLPGER